VVEGLENQDTPHIFIKWNMGWQEQRLQQGWSSWNWVYNKPPYVHWNLTWRQLKGKKGMSLLSKERKRCEW